VRTTLPRKRGRPASQAIRLRRQEEILEAAAKMFAEHGYSQTVTQALADRLQVGKGTIYRYFPSKRALFLAALDRLMQQLHLAINAGIEGIEDPVEQVAQGVHAYLRFVAQRPEFVELLFQERAHFKDRKKPTYFEHRDAHIGRWRELFRALIASGRVRDIPVERITEVLSDLLYGTMFANYFAGRRRPPQEQADDILDIALHGILS
jgi:AcrR family transcriptional regulator